LNGLQGIQDGLCTSGAIIMDSIDHCGVHSHYIDTQDFIWTLWHNTWFIYDLNWTLHGRLGKNKTISDELKINLDYVQCNSKFKWTPKGLNMTIANICDSKKTLRVDHGIEIWLDKDFVGNFEKYNFDNTELNTFWTSHNILNNNH